MDAQDHQKSPSSGHESHGVHVCHNCGWPFPNPHPSAKHRRAHKRVCGKVEGYKLIDSKTEHISDDEQLSDDDTKTPSPKMEEESVKEIGSSDGIGLRSSKSEDDVFSDAVTEFSDSGVSPSVEERLASVGELNKNVGEGLVHGPNENQLSKGNETADMTKPLHDLIAGSGISNAEAIGSLMSQSESKLVSDVEVDKVSSGVDRTEGLVNSCSAVSETILENINSNGESGKHKELISSGPETDTDVKESVNEVEFFTQSVAPDINSASEATLCEYKLEEAEEKRSGSAVLESIVLKAERKTLDTLTTLPKLQEPDGNTSHIVAVGKIVDPEEELNNKLQAEMENVNVEPILHKADGRETDREVKESVNEVEPVAPDIKSASEATLHESKLEEAEEKGSGPVVLESMVPETERNTFGTLTSEPKLHEADGNTSHPLTVGKIVEREEEVNNKLQAEMENMNLEPILREAGGPETDTEAKESVSEVESFTQSVAPDIKSASEATLCESKLEEAEEKGSGSVLLESMVPEAERKALDTLITEPKLQEADEKRSHPVTVGKIVEQEEELNNKLQAEMENKKFEPILREAGGPETDTEAKEGVNEVESFSKFVAPDIKSASEATLCESKLEEAEEKGSGSVLPESMVPEAERKTLDTLAVETKLHEADGNTSNPVIVSKVVEQEEELNKKLQTEMENVNLEPILHEADGKMVTVSTVGEVEQEEAEKTKKDICPQFEPPKCADASVTALVEADSAKDTVGYDQLAEVYDSKVEGAKEMHLLSVAETLPAIEKPEVMIQEFKDYKVLKSSFPLDIGTAEIASSVEDDNKLTVSEPKPSSISTVSDGSLQSSTSDFNLLDHSPEKGGVLASITGEVDASGSRMISEEASATKDLEGPPGNSDFETPKSQTNYFVGGFQANAADEDSLQNGVSALNTMEHSDVIPAVSLIDDETCKETTKSSEVENTDDNVNKKSDFSRTENGTSDSFSENNTSGAQKSSDEVYVDASKELESAVGLASDLSLKDCNVTSKKQSDNSNDTEVQRSIGALGAVSQLNPEDQSVDPDKNTEDSSSEQTASFPVASGISSQNSAANEAGNTRKAIMSAPLLYEGSDKVTKEYLNISAVESSFVSSSRTESLDGNWGSVSVVSTQSDGTSPADAEMPSSTGTQAAEKSESRLLKPQTVAEDSHHKKSDSFDPPSFMTLVESGTGADEKVAASEYNTVQKAEQPSEALQAGWFPSLTNVVNESDGRKKNEEIIANWSTGKQHSPLKNLLSEAHAETTVKAASEKQVPDLSQTNETVLKNNGAPVTTVSSIMGFEMPNNNAAKREMEKEWNSPARYPAEIKKEKKKGKPYWVPFVCCTSVHQDM